HPLCIWSLTARTIGKIIMPATILIRGGGDLASGVALRLHHIGLNVVITEIPKPLAVRRAVAFAEAIYEGQITIEDVAARSVHDPSDTFKILNVISKGQIPVLIDPDCVSALALNPLAIVDARMTKHPPEAMSHHALLYFGLGPGFTAPSNCHAVIETQRGHTLGRVIWNGSSLPDSGQPEGNPHRILRAPRDGSFKSSAKIGEHIEEGQEIGSVDNEKITAPLTGVLRGIIHDGLDVTKGLKIGDIDPRDQREYCFTVSDKALAIGGGVLEALFARPEVRSKLWA
ncbi:MAG TPA: selenium-dependent molybdenum cofactor biosynthesis protein YqeB, partial [Anaerolineales bacterium]|nr:selenium-dependent molybdenum cofactor biosynthesis protein YqeB [Anaerolineales bacterium]